MKKVRDSNIELLRILCMFMIVIHHFIVHGGLWMLPMSSSNKAIIGFLMPFGKIAFDCFVVISCWYLVSSKFKGSRFLKIWLQVLFYNVVFILFTLAIEGSTGSVGKRALFGALFPMIGNSHGFAAAYIAFYMMLPILKKIQHGLSQKQTLYVIYFFGVTQVILPILGFIIDYTQPMQSEFLLFVFIYFLTFYVQNWPIKFLKSFKVKVCILFGILLLIIVNSVLSQYYNHIVIEFIQNISSSEFSLLCIIAGFFVFLVFLDIKLPSNKLINSVASTTFGILLFHDHNYFRSVLWEPFKSLCEYESLDALRLVGAVLGVALIIFISGMLFDFLRHWFIESWVIKTRRMQNFSCRLDDLTDLSEHNSGNTKF